MIRIGNPITVGIIIAALVVGVAVFPFVKTEYLRVTRSKITALLIVFGYCIYHRSLAPALIFLWPLSFIWFPEYWGRFTGYIRGPYIDKSSPPMVVSACGWFFLIVFPVFIIWVMNL